MKLDCTVFENAIHSLEKSRAYTLSDLAKGDKDLYEQFRAASIQSFEFTYELTLKMLRRQLDQIAANPQELREMSFMDFIRTAHEAGLVREALSFKIYRELRNTTSHTYDHKKAEQVLAKVDAFLSEARFVLSEIKKRNT